MVNSIYRFKCVFTKYKFKTLLNSSTCDNTPKVTILLESIFLQIEFVIRHFIETNLFIKLDYKLHRKFERSSDDLRGIGSWRIESVNIDSIW